VLIKTYVVHGKFLSDISRKLTSPVGPWRP
jgi:hypothetical protein